MEALHHGKVSRCYLGMSKSNPVTDMVKRPDPDKGSGRFTMSHSVETVAQPFFEMPAHAVPLAEPLTTMRNVASGC